MWKWGNIQKLLIAKIADIAVEALIMQLTGQPLTLEYRVIKSAIEHLVKYINH